MFTSVIVMLVTLYLSMHGGKNCLTGGEAISRNHAQNSPPSLNAAGILPVQAAQLSSIEMNPKTIKNDKKHLVVVTMEAPPFMMSRRIRVADYSLQNDLEENYPKIENLSIKAIPERNQTGKDFQTEWYGYCVDFFEELIKHLPYDVTYELYRVSGGNFGAKMKRVILEKDEKTGKVLHRREFEEWTGVVGELHKKRAHIALAPLAVMAERELVMDFTVPFYDLVGIQILLKKPEVPKDWFKFLTVLDNDVWLSILIAYFITSFVIYLFDRLSPYSNKNADKIAKMRQANRSRIQHQSSSSSSGRLDQSSSALNVGTNGPLLGVLHGAVAPTSPEKLLFTTETRENSNHTFFVGPTIFPGGGQTNRHQSSTSGSLATKWRRLSRGYIQSVATWRSDAQIGSLGDRTNPSGHMDKSRREEDHYGDEESDEDDLEGPTFNLRDSFWFCITSLTPQGGGEAPQNLSGRVVAGAWWLFCFIVIASYTANLAAFLTVSRLDIPIESLDDLAKQYRIKYAPMDGTAEQTYFERMAYIEEIFYNVWKEMALNDSLSEEERSKFAVWDYPISDKYTKIWSQIQEVGMPQDVHESIMRVKNSTIDDGFALLADANFVKFATMTDCSFKAVGDEFSRKPIALGVAKGHEELRDDLSYAILQLINRRFMEVLREKWWTNNEARVLCDDASEESSEGMSIENIGGVFIIILAGVLFSFFVWAVERFVYKTKLEVSRNMIQETALERNPRAG